eukprot:CAMPEP_0185031342 /NCGR_PEP_ID=MMETSP1103-20130426/18760_1 /TAXON_ID=36769 /ORGANISM="Paraphysomonas bandaiensis, Strain Caron Lab Isolate" /LENGTH=795 /DNA_ID=CAMNT_0027566839 /DNA_START=592 /DNA_END=2979 /DNA_ORIENTATION=+
MAEKGGNGVSVEDSLLFKDLHNSGSSLFHSVSELLAMLSPVATSRTGLGRLLEVSQKELVDLCMQCMSFGGSVRSASEMLKQSTGYAMADVASSNNTPSYLASIQSAVSDWFLGPQGIEKMSFPMMRRQIHFSFTPPASTLNEKDCSDLSSRVHRLRINGSQGNIIDGIFICAQSRTTCTAFSNSATVLFCPPNAGFYECFAMSSPNSSWLWFYLQKLDMNVCVFNYRGYGDSSGVPDPSRVKDDGLAVAQHLKETMKVNYLYLHGESIGGMVACHIARHYGAAVSALVCDRTFVRLEAVASRMLGNWAGNGLKLLGRWDTDVLDNYLHASCPKIVIQDPDDEIIYHASSLKVGIACRVLLGDGSGRVPVHCREYRVASALGLPVTIPEGRSHICRLVERCLMQRKGDYKLSSNVGWSDHENGVTTGGTSGGSLGNDEISEEVSASTQASSCGVLELTDMRITEEFVEHFAACCVNISRRASAEEISRSRSRCQPEADIARTNTSVTTSLEINGSGDDSDDEGVYFHPTTDIAGSTFPEAQEMESSVTTMIEAPRPSNNEPLSGQDRSVYPHNKWVQMEVHCSKSITDSSMSMVEKFWLALSRADGCCGELLGQSVSHGLDGIRAWVACYVIWGGNTGSSDARVASFDTCLPSSRTSVERAVQDMKVLIAQLRDSHQQPPGSESPTIPSLYDPPVDACMLFIAEAMEVMLIQQQQIASGDIRGLHLDGVSHLLLEDTTETMKNARCRARLKLGQLISVHCGHNGWPHRDELNLLANQLMDIKAKCDHDIEKMDCV